MASGVETEGLPQLEEFQPHGGEQFLTPRGHLKQEVKWRTKTTHLFPLLSEVSEGFFLVLCHFVLTWVIINPTKLDSRYLTVVLG